MFKVAALAAAALAATAPSTHATPVRTAGATSYCLHGIMANGRQVHSRAVASNVLPLGTKIRIVGGTGFYGRRLFIVSDTGGALGDGHFDIWSESCSRSISWGRRTIRYQIGWDRPTKQVATFKRGRSHVKF